MALLAGVNYDPSTAASITTGTGSLRALTAIDTTNLRLTFTAPSSGNILIRIRCTIHGAATYPAILLGVLEGATIIGRQAPMGGVPGTVATTTNMAQEALFTVSGVTSGPHTYDAAYGVEIILASTAIKYGGPDDTTANNAWGGFQFEIWEAPSLLGTILYDPRGGSMISNDTTTLRAMTALDTANLRITFTAPASRNVLVRMRGVLHGATTFPQIILGVLESTTVVGRSAPMGGLKSTALTTAQLAVEAEFLIKGISAGSHSYDAAYGVETVVASTGLKYGGPDNNITNDACGGFLFEVWAA